jgi:hypothetical protein
VIGMSARTLRALAGKRFISTKLALFAAVLVLLVFVLAEDFAALGRTPLVALILVTMIRILLARRVLDSWIASALVVASTTATVFLGELSALPMDQVLIIATAVLALVMVALTFSEREAYFGGKDQQKAPHIALDARSVGRVLARLTPMVLALYFLLPEISQFVHQRFPELAPPAAGDGRGGPTERSDAARTGFSTSMDPGRVSNLEPDESPLLVLRSSGPEPSPWSLGTARIVYLRSLSLSDGYGLSWRVGPRDYTLGRAPAPTAQQPQHRILQVDIDEPFLFHLYGTRIRPPNNNIVPNPSGGALIVSGALGPWGSLHQRLIYDLEPLGSDPESRQVPEPSSRESVLQSLSDHSRSPESKRLLRIITGQDLQSSASLPQVTEAIQRVFSEGQFTYTLQPDPILTDDPKMALWSFLMGSRKGFCEHFAGAAASLFQSAGIPARIVSGLMAQRTLGEPYQVFTRADAHAWIEVYDADMHHWVALDPTSWVTDVALLPRSAQQTRHGTSWINRWRRSVDGALLAWTLRINDSFGQESSALRRLNSPFTLKITIIIALLVAFTAASSIARYLFALAPGQQVPGFSSGPWKASWIVLLSLLRRVFTRKQSTQQNQDFEEIIRAMHVQSICQIMAKETGLARLPSESLREYVQRMIDLGHLDLQDTKQFLDGVEQDLYGTLAKNGSTTPAGRFLTLRQSQRSLQQMLRQNKKNRPQERSKAAVQTKGGRTQ